MPDVTTPTALQHRLRRLIKTEGLGTIAQRTGIAEQTLTRMIAGLPVREATVVLVQTKLQSA